MSWLFGMGKAPPPQEAPQFPTLPEGLFPGGAGGGDGGKKDGGGEDGGKSGGGVSQGSWSNFDPTGLERAATAAKELDKSRNFTYNFASFFFLCKTFSVRYLGSILMCLHDPVTMREYIFIGGLANVKILCSLLHQHLHRAIELVWLH